MANLLDVYDASEITVEIGEYDTSWAYTPIKFRRNVNPEMPENTRRVYDKLKFKGTKLTRAENTLTIEEEFQGFGNGLFAFKGMDALIVKVTIEPNDGSTPADPTLYYTNWCPDSEPSWSASDVGEINVTLSGAFDDVTDTEPADNSFTS